MWQSMASASTDTISRSKRLRLELSQSTRPTAASPAPGPVPLPLRVGLLDEAGAPQPFSLGASAPMDEDDEVTYEEVHRQIILIINVLVSIVAVAVFIWVAARHWSVGKRLGLSMGGSGAIAIAEVVVYSGYVRKVKEAKRVEKKKPEIKEIVKSWVIEKDESSGVTGFKEKADDGVRFRKGKHR